jgi:hypothetical protein
MSPEEAHAWAIVEYTLRHLPQRGTVPEAEFLRRAKAAAAAMDRWEAIANGETTPPQPP